MYSVGLNKIISYLESERDRYYKAGISGDFCDSEKCIVISSIINREINNLKMITQPLTAEQIKEINTSKLTKEDLNRLKEMIKNIERRNINEK